MYTHTYIYTYIYIDYNRKKENVISVQAHLAKGDFLQDYNFIIKNDIAVTMYMTLQESQITLHCKIYLMNEETKCIKS